MKNKYLYEIFDKWFLKNGVIYMYSDPHFSDLESYKLRFPYLFNKGKSDEDIVKELDEFQLSNINRVCSKEDTLIILGDVGNVECVKKLKAGYKILIQGNHDKGASYYKRIVTDITDLKANIAKAVSFPKDLLIPEQELNNHVIYDNKLFDEVYSGPLMISDKIILSHEPLDILWIFNIHGHDHSGFDFMTYVLKDYDADMPADDYFKNYLCTVKKYKLNKINLCAEWTNYFPVRLDKIIESGVLKNIENIHRRTINNASKK